MTDTLPLVLHWFIGLFSVLVLDDIFCHDLGMEKGVINDSQISASSAYNDRRLPIYARLNWDSCWIPKQGAISGSWLQVTFHKLVILRGVATQGRHDHRSDLSILTYRLSYSKDVDGNWNVYKEKGIEKVSSLF